MLKFNAHKVVIRYIAFIIPLMANIDNAIASNAEVIRGPLYSPYEAAQIQIFYRNLRCDECYPSPWPIPPQPVGPIGPINHPITHILFAVAA